MNFNKTIKPFVLASGSPRRKELLGTLGIPFDVYVSEVEEDFPQNLEPKNVPGLLSQRKANAVLSQMPGSLIIASDTVVVMNDTILNKPQHETEARLMLESLSGKTHLVYTAFTIANSEGFKTITDKSAVTFKALSSLEIDYYLKNGKPYDKAGAYGIQEWIGLIAVEKIEGSYFTVMGLPTHLVWKELLDGNHLEA